MLRLLEENVSLGNYLQGKGYEHVAIYGLGVIGKHLECILSQQGMMPSFAIDQSRNALSCNFPVITLEDTPMDADLIIVTVTYDYLNICEHIRKHYSC